VPAARLCLSVDLNEPLQVWGGPLSGGRFVLLLLNRLDVESSITALWQHLGLKAGVSMKVRDAMRQTDAGVVSGGLTWSVKAHDVAVFTLSPQ
jgi:alpha-galactosidase